MRLRSRLQATCVLMAFATLSTAASQPVVEVFLPPSFGFEMVHAFHDARGVVEQIYSEIGIRVIWRDRRAPDGCTKQPLHRQIVVAMLPSAPIGKSTEAWAFANPYSTKGPCVMLLMDRVYPAIKKNPLHAGYLLGHVLAHEMGHVLEGIARHSETGVMKQYWSLQETFNMAQKRLGFTTHDAELIYAAFGTAAPLQTDTEGRAQGKYALK